MARDHIGNDPDLLVVMEDDKYNGMETDSLLQRSLEKFYRSFDIDPFILPVSKYLKQLQSGEPFLNKVLKEGMIAKVWDLEKTPSIRRLMAIAEDNGLSFDIEESDVVFIDSI